MNSAKHFSYLLGLLLVWLMTGCVTNTTYGNTEYDNENYDKALDYYEAAFKDGETDPVIYAKAARASVAVGAFQSAERYYSQALRHGAGNDVAAELGEFYIRTSNYASAVRVYQYLLNADAPNKRKIYNNLGTALLYAGKPFDAESYLMIAQQMDPESPYAYLNLALLYDEHLRQPWLAINFYECFVEIGKAKKANTDKAAQRLKELQSSWDRLYNPDALQCRKPYSPTSAERVDLKTELGAITTDGGEKSIVVGNPNTPIAPIEVQRMVTKEGLTGSGETVVTEQSADERVRAAREAFKKKNYQGTEANYSLVPISKLDREDKRDLGIALLELNRNQEAISWLELSLNDREAVDTLESLIEAYVKTKQEERLLAICAKYLPQMKYQSATKQCPAAALKQNDLLNKAPAKQP